MTRVRKDTCLQLTRCQTLKRGLKESAFLMLQVYSWGCNASGQLGLGDFVDRRAPAHVEGLWALPVASLAAGDSHSAALTMNGFLFSWGANDKGQLGLPKNAEAAAQVCSQHSSTSWTLTTALMCIMMYSVPDLPSV